ncbi:enoyl-CoA hydratase-related protein [Maritimibacter sp. DP1N21-5]|uniref:enoyl-CoA hydratase-related protein n=1 Tax=Maritimibacter sp. DP1N21-5 TaxID=2836867 RepID=UPI001C43796E|nr:enoyl-CoA hydratase-related protein [Maritimibacter sp. DP1N21-5]MBV7407458.1 enoyl-CoA hydratase/isomerase family protein [Maritimibacter sp. DP1N21-5]
MSSDSADPPVLAARHEGAHGMVQVITLNRPHVSNAMNAEGSYLVDRYLREAEADPEVGAIILTGAGERAFCAGMDLKEAAERGAGHGLVPGAGFCGVTERVIAKPVIGAINGAAVAGGLEISLACDLLVAGSGVVFGLPEVKRGMVAFTGGVQRLSTQLPRQIAMEIICVGSLISAERLYELGVVNRVVPQADVLPAALALADDLLANSWTAIAFGKELFNHAMNEPLPDAIARGHANADRLMRSDDSREGIAAYAEKRNADFKRDNL